MNTLVKIALVCFLAIQHQASFAWGMTGHRVIAEIAERHLHKKTKKNIQHIIGNQKIAYWSNWADFIKSDPNPELSRTGSSHFINTPGNLSLADFKNELQASSDNNLYKTYLRIRSEAADRSLPMEQQQQKLYFMIHLLADAHQPMHVGRAEDLGGNKIQVEFFGRKANIHRVWDSDLVENEKYSFTEYASVLDIYKAKDYRKYTDTNLEQWLYETHELANTIYADVAENANLSYTYIYKFKYPMEEALLKAGVRLAKELNAVYGKS